MMEAFPTAYSLGGSLEGLPFGAELEHAEKAHEILLHMNRIEQNAKYGSIDAKACNMVEFSLCFL